MKRQKLYSLLLIFGAGILLFRTLRLLTVENGWEILAVWVLVLTFVEMSIDLLCIFYSFRWFFRGSESLQRMSLRAGAAAALFHAFRVVIYAFGRLGPWVGFDRKPAFRQAGEVDLFWVYFASILSVLGVAAVIIIWLRIRKKKN